MGLRGEGSRLGTPTSLRQDQAESQEAQAVRLRAKNGQILASVRIIDGKKERRCTGPSHSEPTWLPDTDKYFYMRKSGKYAGTHVSRCRLCSAWRSGLSLDESGYVPAHVIKPFLIEGINRVGIMEFCRRSGVTQTNAYKIRHNRQRRVTRSVAKRIMLEVVSMRRKNEVRHRASIKAGASVRGLPEKEVTSPSDLYQPESDEQRKERLAAEAERGRQRRKVAKLTPV